MLSSKSNADTIWLVRGGLLVFGLAAIGNALGLWDCSHWVAGLPTLCPVRALTGHACPGCGMGRALALLAHGQIAASLYQHPFGLPLLLWMLCWAVLPERLRARVQQAWLLRGSIFPSAAVALLILWWLAGTVP